MCPPFGFYMKHTTTNFYIPHEFIQNGRVKFPAGESRHLVKVLRVKQDDEVAVVDGAGKAYWVKITRADDEYARGEIIRPADSNPEPNIEVTLAVGTIKPRRLEWAWDACVQLGVSRLIPLRTDYGLDRIREDGKFSERLTLVSIRAMKQSGRAFLPDVSPPANLDEVLSQQKGNRIFLADPEGLPNFPVERPKLGEKILLLVGPEGGFSAEERRIIADAGGIYISLGPRRLRAETAAVVLSTLALRWTEDI